MWLRFKINAKTFFKLTQHKPKNFLFGEKVFRTSKNDILYDLYSGIGTIGQILSKDVKKVVGIDIVEDSINYANENSKLNNLQIQNTFQEI